MKVFVGLDDLAGSANRRVAVAARYQLTSSKKERLLRR
jgi:hypothetical protein